MFAGPVLRPPTPPPTPPPWYPPAIFVAAALPCTQQADGPLPVAPLSPPQLCLAVVQTIDLQAHATHGAKRLRVHPSAVGVRLGHVLKVGVPREVSLMLLLPQQVPSISTSTCAFRMSLSAGPLRSLHVRMCSRMPLRSSSDCSCYTLLKSCPFSAVSDARKTHACPKHFKSRVKCFSPVSPAPCCRPASQAPPR